MPFPWLALALFAGTTVLSGLLQKAPKVSASALGELQVPTAEEGRNLPVVWGTCVLKAPNVVWYGDYKCDPIKKSMGILAFGRSYTAGYRYSLGMDLALCHGQIDALVDVLGGTGEDLKHLAWVPGTEQPDGTFALHVTAQDAYGGDDKEGGVSGWGTVYRGSESQSSDAYVSGKIGAVYPAYRGVCHVVCQQWYLGTSQYIKNLGFVVRRCPANLGLSAAQWNISGDANPAEIIYDILTSPAWGLGFPAARIDRTSFAAAGVTLAAEAMGMSLLLDSPKQADQTIETILQHIDGVCYTDPSTGLWTLKLVRPDYDPATLPEYGPDQIQECELSRGSWEDTQNEVKVTYTDRATWKSAVVQAHDGANFAARNGELASASFEFSGFSNAAIAQKACNREMRELAYPIGKGRLRINRAAWALRMGSPFRLTWPPLGIDGMAVRVTSIDYGSLTAGTIEIEFAEDVFSAAYTAYAPPGGSQWTDPNTGVPVPPIAQLLEEAPYQVIGSAERRLLVGPVRGDGGSDGFQVWSDEGTGFYQTTEGQHFTPMGTLQAAYPRTTASTDLVGFVVAGTDLGDVVSVDTYGRVRGDSLLVIVDAGGAPEWCAFGACTPVGDGTYTIAPIMRGVYDTLPRDHPAGAKVFVVSGATYYNPVITRDTPYAIDQTVSVKCLPHNSGGYCTLAQVTGSSVVLASRAQRPYPPGKVRINGQEWPNGAHLGAVDATLTWQHRHRTAQSGTAIVAQDANSVVGGPEGTYTVDVLIAGVVKRTQAAIAGTSFAYTQAQRAADDPDLQKAVQFRLTPVNGTLTGTVRITDAVVMAA